MRWSATNGQRVWNAAGLKTGLERDPNVDDPCSLKCNVSASSV